MFLYQTLYCAQFLRGKPVRKSQDNAGLHPELGKTAAFADVNMARLPWITLVGEEEKFVSLRFKNPGHSQAPFNR